MELNEAVKDIKHKALLKKLLNGDWEVSTDPTPGKSITVTDLKTKKKFTVMVVKEEVEDLEEVLNLQARLKRGRMLRRLGPKLQRMKRLRSKRMADTGRLDKRSRKAAIRLIRKRVAGERGKRYAELGPSEKITIDKLVKKRANSIGRIAKRILPKVRKAEMDRLARARKSTNEEISGINELSTRTLSSYVKNVGAENTFTKKRVAGLNQALTRVRRNSSRTKTEEVQDVSELSRKTLASEKLKKSKKVSEEREGLEYNPKIHTYMGPEYMRDFYRNELKSIGPGKRTAEVSRIMNRLKKLEGKRSYFLHKGKEVTEAKSSYDLYHKSYTAAIQHALDHHKKHDGIEVSDDDRFSHIGTGPAKPAEGKTVRHNLPASSAKGKNSHVISIQVYNRGNHFDKPYELNTYANKAKMPRKSKGLKEMSAVHHTKNRIRQEIVSDRKKHDRALDNARSLDTHKRNRVTSSGSGVRITREAEESLLNKACEAGISFGAIKEVYDRGYLSASKFGKETREQQAFNRVNSFLAGGQAIHLDNDVVEVHADGPLHVPGVGLRIKRGDSVKIAHAAWERIKATRNKENDKNKNKSVSESGETPPIEHRSLYAKTYMKHGKMISQSKSAAEKAYGAVKAKYGDKAHDALLAYHTANSSKRNDAGKGLGIKI